LRPGFTAFVGPDVSEFCELKAGWRLIPANSRCAGAKLFSNAARYAMLFILRYFPQESVGPISHRRRRNRPPETLRQKDCEETGDSGKLATTQATPTE
jgi:hypothetical protein